MSKFVKLEDGTYVNISAIHRLHLEKHKEPDKFWKWSALLLKPEGGTESVYLAGEYHSVKEAEEAMKKFGK